MALELKGSCEKCEATLTPGGAAYICSYECTYCATWAEQVSFVCRNCEAEVVRRPCRTEAANPVSADA